MGCDPLLARALAHLALRIGRQLAEAAKCRRQVVQAIRIIAKPASRTSGVRKAATFLLAASDKCSAVETLFYEANFSASEFLELLYSIVYCGELDQRRVIEIAADISSRLRTRRGRTLSPASAAHEFLLDHLQCGYTWNVGYEDYSDPLTQATRQEFDDPDFSPRSARRRMNARRSKARQTSHDPELVP
jgi:hypothetical protein